MQGIPFYKQLSDCNMIPGLKLMGFWFAGLSLGFLAARFYGGTLVSLLAQAPEVSASARDVVWMTLLPLIVSVIAVFFFRSGAVYPVCLFWGFCLGFSSGGLLVCYADAGWMMALLLQFSAFLCSPVLLWYWWRRLYLGMRELLWDALGCASAEMAIGAADYWVITPFLTDVINYS